MNENEEIPWIGPQTWQAGLAFCANKVQDHIDLGVQYPSDDGIEMLEILRSAFDDVSFIAYGRAIDQELKAILTDRFIAFAVLTMQMNGVWDNQKTPLLEEIHNILPFLESKQRDYGYHNISRFGLSGLFVRMHDKLARLENLVDKEVEPMHEPLMDSMVDFVGYCLIGLMVIHDMWELPMNPRPLADLEES